MTNLSPGTEFTLDYYYKRLRDINNIVNTELPITKEAGPEFEALTIECIKALSDVAGWRQPND